MGEAKRRKQLDPNYGKQPEITVSRIEVEALPDDSGEWQKWIDQGYALYPIEIKTPKYCHQLVAHLQYTAKNGKTLYYSKLYVPGSFGSAFKSEFPTQRDIDRLSEKVTQELMRETDVFIHRS